MRSFWKIMLLVSCVAVIGGAALTWQVWSAKANGLKLAEDAMVCRLRAEQGDAKAEANLGNMYSHGQGVPQDYAEAVRWYRKAADQGDPEGQDGLAFMYSQGEGVPQDLAESLRWCRKAANQGDANAQNYLGVNVFPGTRSATRLRRSGPLVPQSRGPGLRKSSIQPRQYVLLRPRSATEPCRGRALVAQGRRSG
jgi:Sel1 repeat